MQADGAVARSLRGFEHDGAQGIGLFGRGHAETVQADDAFHVFDVVALEVGVQSALERRAVVLRGEAEGVRVEMADGGVALDVRHGALDVELSGRSERHVGVVDGYRAVETAAFVVGVHPDALIFVSFI